MSLLTILGGLIIVGAIAWGIQRATFLNDIIKNIALTVIVIFTVIWLVQSFLGVEAVPFIRVH